MFELRNRAYTDNDTTEVAGKLLPAHPVARYKKFPLLWKKTRQISGYVPRPKNCTGSEDDFFPCCLSCAAVKTTENLKETLVRRSANAGWLSAEWWWDFGWTLPEEFVGYGIGVTPPDPPVERDRVFVLDTDFKRQYLDIDLKEHATAGANQHEARIKITTTAPNVNYPGEIIVTSYGRIFIATPRTRLFGKGIEIYERYIFEAIEMPYLLPILLDNVNFEKKGDKILLNGVELN